ncbi:fluoride efflux transporter CrcB [Rhodococcus maanshanensis]|uniref:Fluoride-specific ion channel FluC n=1 Tax=Rhodococcus maanshanensis TaxID=183556 RepID=A0A1H7F2U0_9NOCA|nr:fluoride efflux transporter CrcB [Rhodococcus maanshanensis]SEK20401.1 CrcB protein [Rhodococcus maanshanensis]
MTVVLVVVGGMVGAPLRFLLDRAVGSRTDSEFPWGTLTVNVIGSLILGALVGAAAQGSPVMALVGTGFCGALTTYSTFGYETVRLVEDGVRMYALANVVVSVAAGIAAAALGFAGAHALFA